MPRQLSLAVVGANFPNKRGPTRRFEIALCPPGEPVELVPEPKNKADEHAIMVLSCRGVQMGYVTAERAPWIGGLMRDGHELTAIFQEATGFGAVVRLGIDCEPRLPPARPTAPEPGDSQLPEREFWPDEEWPD